VVVVNPGWGDAVQANKAGLMEIADVFVINKADRAGVNDTRRDLETMLEMSELRSDDWRPPIVCTVAARSEGVDELWDAVLSHREHLSASGGLERRRSKRVLDELRTIVARTLELRAYELTTDERFEELHQAVLSRRLDPYAAADEILGDLS
jgi:LAO/AO transport system kinase